MSLIRRQDPHMFRGERKKESKHGLGVIDLTLMSIGAVIGTGVLVLPGVVAATTAGPAEIISFIIAGIASIFVVLCYAEFGSSIHSAGGSYTYIYVALGEIFAYISGLSVVFGYILSLGLAASGWSAYFQGLLADFNIHLPSYLSLGIGSGGFINLPAVLVTLFIVYILSLGTQESKMFNNIVVLIKISVVIVFIGVGFFYVNTNNWAVFMPFGLTGVFSGASTLFLAYTGFDITVSAAEESKNPQKALPIALISSIIICAIIYIIVSLIVTGMIPFRELNKSDALAYVLQFVGQHLAAGVLSVGAVVGLLSIIFANSFGTSRILSALSKDRLIPKALEKKNSKNVPIVSLWVVGGIGAILGGFANLNQLADLSTISLLLVYLLVSVSVIVFRKTNPDFKRGFKTPFVPIIPILSILCCGFLMVSLSPIVWIEFAVFLVIILIFYFAYSYKKAGAHVRKIKKRKGIKASESIEVLE